jgi:hypothetical protein
MKQPKASPWESLVGHGRLVAKSPIPENTAFRSPLPEPSIMMSMKIPQNTPKAVKNVRNLLLLSELYISCHLSLSNIQLYI